MKSRSPWRGIVALAALGFLSSCAGTGASVTSSATSAGESFDDPIEALQSARAELVGDPSNVDALFRVGLAWQQRAAKTIGASQKDYQDSARVAYEALLAVDPDNVEGLVHSGLVLEELGRGQDALARYDRAIELDPSDPLPHINRGSLLYFDLKQTSEAVSSITKALELAPDNPDARFNLGVMFADSNLYREAAVEWNAVLELAEEGSPAHSLARENLDRIQPLLDQLDGSASAGAAE